MRDQFPDGFVVEREFPGGERELRSQFAGFGQIGYRAIILTFGKFTVGGGIKSPNLNPILTR